MRPPLVSVVALLALLLVPVASAAAEEAREIHLKSGEVVEVVVVEETDTGLLVRTDDGAVVELLYSDIKYVRAIPGEPEDAVVPAPASEPPPPPAKTREELEHERAEAEELRRWEREQQRRRSRRYSEEVEVWRKPGRAVGLGTGVPFFTAGVAIASLATPYSLILGDTEGFYIARNTGVLLMGAFIPSGVLGSLMAHEAVEKAGGDFDAGLELGVAGGVVYSIGLGLYMTALDWPTFEDQDMAAPFGIASIPTLITGFVLLCADIDETTRAARKLDKLRRPKVRTDTAPVRVIPWATSTGSGAVFGLGGRF